MNNVRRILIMVYDFLVIKVLTNYFFKNFT